MRGLSVLAVAVATRVGTVQLNSKVLGEIGDATLGKVLANQLKLAPKVDSVEDAAVVNAWSSSMFDKPSGVFLALIGGYEVPNGVALESSCEATKECVGGTCYASELPCVAQTLLAQSQTQLVDDLHSARPEATVVAITDSVPKDDAVEQLRKVAKVNRHGTELSVIIDEASATLDTTQPCVQRLVGEATSIVSAPPATLVVLTPSSVACMHAQYGNTEPTQVADALIRAAVKSAEKKNADSFSVIVNTLSRTLVAETKPAVLIESDRRLEALKAGPDGVADFHIYAWSSLGMVFALLAAVYSIVAMTNDRDPLLYAKFRPEVDATSRR